MDLRSAYYHDDQERRSASGTWSQKRGTKLIIGVTDGRSRLVYPDNDTYPMLGVVEDVAMVTIHPTDLPENVIGYEAVDGIVWLDADPAALKAGGGREIPCARILGPEWAGNW